MTRAELLRKREYWITQFQINLFETVDRYLQEKGISRKEFADELGVSKGYISQILNGDFDHKISKFVDLLLACKSVPLISIVGLEEYIGDEICGINNAVYSDMEYQILPKHGTEPKSIPISYKSKIKKSYQPA